MEEDISTFDWARLSKFSNTTFSLKRFRISFEIIIDRHSKIRKKRVKGKPSPWLSAEVLSLMRRRDRLREIIGTLNANERSGM